MFKKYGREEIESLRWDNAAEKIIEIYKNIIIN